MLPSVLLWPLTSVPFWDYHVKVSFDSKLNLRGAWLRELKGMMQSQGRVILGNWEV
jgi:hypothetical protein